MDNGQLNRIKNSKKNEEYGIAFPAVLIHYIDVYYNQGTSRIAEGRGTMRIHYILNRMNNSDDGEEGELEGMAIYKRIIDAIESKRTHSPLWCLVSSYNIGTSHFHLMIAYNLIGLITKFGSMITLPIVIKTMWTLM